MVATRMGCNEFPFLLLIVQKHLKRSWKAMRCFQYDKILINLIRFLAPSPSLAAGVRCHTAYKLLKCIVHCYNCEVASALGLSLPCAALRSFAAWPCGVMALISCSHADALASDKRQVFWNWMKLIIIDKSAHFHIISSPQSKKKRLKTPPLEKRAWRHA
jgi:hypothetical protein